MDFFVPGVPASRVLRKGDIIVAIDGENVNESTIASALTGSDTPGSTVKIYYRAPDTDAIKDVDLTRIATETFADRKNMLELLRQLRASAVAKQDEGARALVDSTLDLWHKMLSAEEDLRSQVEEESGARKPSQ